MGAWSRLHGDGVYATASNGAAGKLVLSTPAAIFEGNIRSVFPLLPPFRPLVIHPLFDVRCLSTG